MPGFLQGKEVTKRICCHSYVLLLLNGYRIMAKSQIIQGDHGQFSVLQVYLHKCGMIMLGITSWKRILQGAVVAGYVTVRLYSYARNVKYTYIKSVQYNTIPCRPGESCENVSRLYYFFLDFFFIIIIHAPSRTAFSLSLFTGVLFFGFLSFIIK